MWILFVVYPGVAITVSVKFDRMTYSNECPLFKRDDDSGGDTVSDCAVVMSSANGMVGTGFASRFRLQPRAGF